MTATLNETDIRKALSDLPGWSQDGDKITKTFQFQHFREAVSFIVRVAFEAEERNHHPELSNVYNKVTLSLSTHDADDKVTEKDIDLAKAVEHLNWTGG